MPTTSQMLLDYPDILIQVLAELRGAFVDTSESREQAIELLSAQITDPTSVQMAYEEVTDYLPQTKEALETLLKEGGEMVEAQFSRQFGAIRQMGPSKLERESPWLYPESTAELLYYYGLVGRGFKGAGQSAHTVIYVPSDVTPWLPHPSNPALEGGLSVLPAPTPPSSRQLLSDDSLLEDMGTLLGFLHSQQMRLTPEGPHSDDIDRLVSRLQIPFGEGMQDLNVRLALMLHLANRLGWLRRGDDGCVHLTGNRLRIFLDKTRAEQRSALWEAWRTSADWNDLCRTPGLECADTGSWKNDPLQTRSNVVQLLAKLQAGSWFSQDEVIRVIKETEPDFQRPTGNYDSWYIRDTTTQEFLKGFEHWDQVEGALLRFLFRGPLYWLRVLDLAEPSAGDDYQISLSQWGTFWLGLDTPQPHEQPRRPMVVNDDFTITVPLGTPLADRFRVERFASWQASYPQFVYQISQRGLKRAIEEGIAPDRIVAFLQAQARSVPENVVSAIEKYSSERVH